MDLKPGQIVGGFEIVGALGAGGMGEVYRARDTRLGREVALKALPRSVSQDPERLARFEREAQLLASLNHPSIGAIYGVEDSPNGPLLVLELVPGETLEDILRKGRLPLAQAMSISRKIADAVAFAHASGIVHRDLKPANIKCTPQGAIKVLDFGVAKALAPQAPKTHSEAPTIDVAGMTVDGDMLGTPAYMSPEQTRAKDVDRRSDIWSFGCILYEMLTGRRLFQRQTVTDTLVAILGEDPDWTALPASTAQGVRTLLRRCLQRDRDLRVHDMADVRIELDDALASIGAGDGSQAQPASTKLRPLEIGAAVVLVLMLLVNGVFLYVLAPSLKGLYAQAGITLPQPLHLYLMVTKTFVFVGDPHFFVTVVAKMILAAIAVVWGGFKLAGRSLPPNTRRAVLVVSASIVGAGTLHGGYSLAEASLVHAMRLSIAWRTQGLQRDLTALYLAGGEPAQAIAQIDPRLAPQIATKWVNWDAPALSFQLAEAYRAQGNVEVARKMYRRAQEEATAFDVLSEQSLIQQEFWQYRLGVHFADWDWAYPVADMRKLPNLVRTVSQQRLDQLARDEAAKR